MIKNTMENKPTNVEELFEKFRDYADTRINLVKLKGIHKVSGFMSTLIASLVLVVLLCIVLLCITIGLALLIGSLLGRAYLGFFIVGALYLIIGLVFYSMRAKLIKTPISNKLIKELVD
jgi:Putative Actinobacterial Holin-X, holin superfamily III